MRNNAILEAYFEYLMGLVSSEEFPFRDNYWELGWFLMSKEFTWTIRNDENRAKDGLLLRQDFFENGAYPDGEIPYDFIIGGCSILEMMVALAVRIEQDIMGCAEYEDRTSEWFWIMIEGLELQKMTDFEFDLGYCNWVIDRFLRHKYEKNGLHGGLFHVLELNKNCRRTEIWMQMEWFFDENFEKF